MSNFSLPAKAIKAKAITDNDATYLAFQRALTNIEAILADPKQEHPLVSLVAATSVLDAIAGSDELVRNWRRKLNNVPCIALVDRVDQEGEVDPLGFFFNTDDLPTRLSALECDASEVSLRIAEAKKERRAFAEEVFSCICINRKAIQSFSEGGSSRRSSSKIVRR